MRPEAIQQLDYVLLFKGHPEAKLLKLWTDCDLSVTFDFFKKLYQHATKDKYNFLYVSTRDEVFKKNFNKQYIVTEEVDRNNDEN